MMFRQFLAGALLSIAASAAGAGAVDIHDNGGGWIDQFEAQARGWSASRTKVRLLGQCDSACTMYIWAKFNLDICAGPKAKLGFHMPFLVDGPDDKIVVNARQARQSRWEWQRQWLPQYPTKLRRFLRSANIPNPSEKGETRKLLVLKAQDFLPPCRETRQANSQHSR